MAVGSIFIFDNLKLQDTDFPEEVDVSKLTREQKQAIANRVSDLLLEKLGDTVAKVCYEKNLIKRDDDEDQLMQLPDNLSKFSHEALTALSHCGDSEIEQQARDVLANRYAERVPVNEKEFVVEVESKVMARVKCKTEDEARILIEQEIVSKNNNCGLIPMNSCDPRVVVLGVNVVLKNTTIREDHS